jgi:glycosyltransferase involved in cell wall biosynthesis
MSDAGTRPLRVLQILRSMEVGGAETLVMNLYRHINRSRIQFDFLLFSDRGYYEPEILELGGVIHRLPYLTDVGLLSWLRQLGRFFRAHPQYRIVHSHLNTISGPILMMAKRAGVPVRIAHSHACGSRYRVVERPIRWVFRRMLLPSATHLMACSHAAGSWLFGKPNEHQVAVLRNAIDLTAFRPSDAQGVRRCMELNDRLVIGHVGSFSRAKNHVFLIDLMPELIERNPDIMLVFVGDGPLRPEIQRQVASMGLQEQVRFLGVRSDIAELMSLFDVFAFPSLFEGLGIVLIEAQATGLRCVVSDAVPTEADMGVGLVDFVSLDDGEAWVTRLLEPTGPRKDTHAALCARGYDIRQTAGWLQSHYPSLR